MNKLKPRAALAVSIAVALYASSTPIVFAQTQTTPPTASEEAKELDQVEVIGLREATRNARQRERDTDTIVNIIAADDVGNFADQSVGDALQRVSGLAVDRDAGEARRLTVRGLNAQFSPVNINGMRIGTQDLDRDAVIDVLPSDLLGVIEVNKTLTPDMDADAIGGAINLIARDPFESKQGGSLRAEANSNSNAGGVTPRNTVSYTNRLDLAEGSRFGYSLAFSYSERDIEGTTQRNRDVPVFSTLTPPLRLPTDPQPVSPGNCFDSEANCFFRSRRVDSRFDESNRTRIGFAANMDYFISQNHEMYLRLIGSDFARDEILYTDRYDFGNTITALGSNTASFRNAELRKSVNLQEQDSETWLAQFGGTSKTENWRFDYMLGASNNTFERSQQNGRFRIRGINASYVQTEDTITVTPSSGTAATANINNLANYVFDNLILNDEVRRDNIRTLKLDAKRNFEWGDDDFGSIKFGVKFDRRDKTSDRTERSGTPPAGTNLSNVSLANLDTGIPGFGLMPDPFNLVSLYANTAAGAGITTATANSGFEDFSVAEDIDSAYIMGTWDITPDFSLFGGVRLEKTSWKTSGQLVETIDPLVGANVTTSGPSQTFDVNYNNVLPSLHARWNYSENMVFRASLSKAVVRPNYDEGSATSSISTNEVTAGVYNRTYNGGNPLLNPLTANQFDLSWTWYPQEDTVLYAGLFYKEINDFYVNAVLTGNDVTLAGLPIANGTVNGGFDAVRVVFNGDSAKIQGIELAAEHRFSFWPGLFASANLTWLDSKSTVPLLRGNQTVPLVDQADKVANLSVGWENEKFSFRISGNHRGEQLDTLATTAQLDQVVKAYTSYDFNARWNVFEGLQFYLDVGNLNNEKETTQWRGDENGSIAGDEGGVESYGRSYAIGFRLDF
jgi:iron complex outermembrane recepter protein